MPSRELVAIKSFENEELPLPRWRLVRDQQHVDLAWGLMIFGAPGCDWAFHIYLGKWVVGFERTSA